MSPSRKRRIGLAICTLTAGILVAALLISGVSAATPLAAGESQALKVAASRSGQAPSDLAVANSAEAHYPTTGKSALSYKIQDKETGEMFAVTLDANGKEVREGTLAAQESAAYRAKYGGLEPDLAALVAVAPAKEPIPVLVWLKESGYTPPARISAEDASISQEAIDASHRAADSQRAAFVDRLVAPVVNRLAEMHYEVGTNNVAPVLAVALLPADITTVGGWSEVDTVYLSRLMSPDLDIARQVIGAQVVWTRHIAGFGVKTAVIEVGGQFAAANPYLAGIVNDTTYSCLSGHTTAVAGILHSQNPGVFGIAPASNLWVGGSCGGVDAQLQDRTNAAMNWGAIALNLSWGADIGLVPGALDRFYDALPRNSSRFVAKSAGNQAPPCGANGNITSPGLGYNVTAVGNFDDKNTTAWGDDTFANTCSSWRDPTSTYGDREKPEVAAPGTDIKSTTTAAPWTGSVGSGTSYASPMVMGGVTLLMQRQGALQSWPESVKAILMASAVHNIEGSTRLSEKDGAGAILLDRADDIARGVNGWFGGTGYVCGSASPFVAGTIYLQANVRTRVVIVWDQDPAYAGYALQPSADLDLKINGPTGTLVATSNSFDNTYEIAEFTPTVTGNHKIKVFRFRCDSSPVWLGWAWRQGN